MKATFKTKEVIIEGLPKELLDEAEEVIKTLRESNDPGAVDEETGFLENFDQKVIALFSGKNKGFPEDMCGWLPSRVEEGILYYEPECPGCPEFEVPEEEFEA